MSDVGWDPISLRMERMMMRTSFVIIYKINVSIFSLVIRGYVMKFTYNVWPRKRVAVHPKELP